METTEGNNNNNNSSIKLYIDQILSNKRFSLFSTVSSLIIVVIYILASNSPDSFIIRDRPEADPLSSVYTLLAYPEKSFDILENPVIAVDVRELGLSNKFIVLDMAPLKLKSNESIEVEVQIETSAFAILEGKVGKQIVDKEKRSVNFTCSLSQNAPCNIEEIIRVPVSEKQDFYFVTKILNNQEVASKVENFRVRSVSFNLSSRIYLFAVKILFIFATIVSLCWFSAKVKAIDPVFLTLEQKTFPFLTTYLIIINEPITTYFADYRFYVWVISFLFAGFSTFLVKYWLSKMHEIGGSDSSLIDKSSTFVKLYSIFYFVVVSVAYVEYGNIKLRDPLAGFYGMEDKIFALSKVLFFVALLIILVWGSFKFQRILERSHDIPERENSFFLYSLFFLVTHLLMVLTGMLSPVNSDTFKIILFCGISTLYVLSAGYLFLPTKEGIEQAIHLKKYDNPAARDRYKDLEDSVHHEEKHSIQNQKTDQPLVTGGSDPVKSLTEVEKAYPYEKHDHDDH